MTPTGARSRSGGRSGLFLLALLAVALKVLIPPGVMAAPTGAIPLVICTGHGPATANLGGKKTPAERKGADAPCAYAGHALLAGPPAPVRLANPLPRRRLPGDSIVSALVRGPSLASPPPPSLGPPRRLA